MLGLRSEENKKLIKPFFFKAHSNSCILGIDILSEVVGDDVKVFSSLGGDDSRPLLFEALFISRKNAEFFQDLEGVSDKTTSNLSVVISRVAASLLSTVDFLQVADTDMRSQVDLSGNGGYRHKS